MSICRRWYDQEFACRKLLEQIREMPHFEAREFCARIIIHFTDRLHKSGQGKGGLSSIGIPGLHSLYKFGRQKRRWYDKGPTLHMAVASFYTLPKEGLSTIGFKLGDTFGLIRIYAVVCSQVDQVPHLEDMAKICTTSLQASPEEAREVVIQIIGLDLYNALSTSIKEEIAPNLPNTT